MVRKTRFILCEYLCLTNIRCDKPTKKMSLEKKIKVDLDALKKRQPRVIGGVPRPDVTTVTIKCTTEVPMAVIGAYLHGKMEFDNSVLMAISK